MSLWKFDFPWPRDIYAQRHHEYGHGPEYRARVYADWFEQIPVAATEPSRMNSQVALDSLRNPYTDRWSFGFQRKLAGSLLLDVSYVGSKSHRLTTRADWNPRLPLGTLRLYPDYGQVIVKTSEGNSSYHSLQTHLDRHLARGFQSSASPTWSKMIDSTSDEVGNTNVQEPASGNLTSVPVMYGGMKLDRGVSDFEFADGGDPNVDRD